MANQPTVDSDQAALERAGKKEQLKVSAIPSVCIGLT